MKLVVLLLTSLLYFPALAQFTFQPTASQTPEVSLGSFNQGDTSSPSIVLLFKNTSSLTATMNLSLTNNSQNIFKVSLNRCANVLASKTCQVTITASNIRTLNGEANPGTKYESLFSYNTTDSVPVSLRVIGSLPPGGVPAGVYSFSPQSLSFSSTVSVSSVSLNNASSVSKATSLTISGTNSNRFSIMSNTCANPLLASSSCTITVSFNSSSLSEGSYSASLHVGSDFVIPLSATLTAPGGSGGGGSLPVDPAAEVSDSSLTFTPSVFRYVSQALSISNVSSTPWTPSLSITGGDSSHFNIVVNRCTGQLNPLKVCTVIVNFDTKNASTIKNSSITVSSGSVLFKTVSLVGQVVPLVKRTLSLVATTPSISQTEVTINPNSNGEVNLPMNASGMMSARIPDGSEVRVRMTYDPVKVTVLSWNSNCVLVDGPGYKECSFILSADRSVNLASNCASPYVLDYLGGTGCILPTYNITIDEFRDGMTTGGLSYRINDGFELPLMGPFSALSGSKVEVLIAKPTNGRIDLSIPGFACSDSGCVLESLDGNKETTAVYACDSSYFNDGGTCSKRTLTLQSNVPQIGSAVLGDGVSYKYAIPSTGSLVSVNENDAYQQTLSNLDNGTSVKIQVLYDAVTSSVNINGFSSCDDNSETTIEDAPGSVLDLNPNAKIKTCITSLYDQKVLDITFTCNLPGYRLIGSACVFSPSRSYLSIMIQGSPYQTRDTILTSINNNETQNFLDSTYGLGNIGKIRSTGFGGYAEVDLKNHVASASVLADSFYKQTTNLGPFEFFTDDTIFVDQYTVPVIYYMYDYGNSGSHIPSSLINIGYNDLDTNYYCGGMNSDPTMTGSCIKRFDYGSFMVWYGGDSMGLHAEEGQSYQWKIAYCDDPYKASYSSTSPPSCMPTLSRSYSLSIATMYNGSPLPDVYYNHNTDYQRSPYLEIQSYGVSFNSQTHSLQQGENQNNQYAWMNKKVMINYNGSMGDYSQSVFAESHNTQMWLDEDFRIRLAIPSSYTPPNGPGSPINSLADMGLSVIGFNIDGRNMIPKLSQFCSGNLENCYINREMYLDGRVVKWHKDDFSINVQLACSDATKVYYPEFSKCLHQCNPGTEIMASNQTCCPYETPYWDYNNNQCSRCQTGWYWDEGQMSCQWGG